MKRIAAIVGAALAVAAVAGIVLAMRGRDERAIRKNIKEIAESASKSKEDQFFTLLGKSETIKSRFAPDCRVAVEGELPEIAGAEALAGIVLQVLHSIQELKVEIDDVGVTVAPDRLGADSVMTARAIAPSPSAPDVMGGGGLMDLREVKIQWRKIDGKWRVARLDARKVLR